MTLKNLFLLTAVIGCGLFATVLKTTKSSQQAGAELESVILVPAIDLPVGTKLEKEKLASLIRRKKVNRAEVPPNAILNEDELIGTTVTSNLKADECLLVTNVGRIHGGCCMANGKHLYVIKLPYEHVGPWVQPGREVDVVWKHRTPGTSVVRHIKLLDKIPVLALDYEKPETNTGGKPIIYTVTLEVGLYETSWLQMAQDAGASLRLLVRTNNGGCPKLPDEELYELFKGAAKEKQDRLDGKK